VDLQAVLQKIREAMRQQFPLVRDIFRRFDTDHNGVLALNEFKQLLQKFGFQLSEEEVLIIMRHFDLRKDGQVSYNEFCDVLLDEDFTADMLSTKPALESYHDENYESRAHDKSYERVETEKVRKAMRDLGDVFYRHTGVKQKIFKEFTHMTHVNSVTVEQIHAALLKIGFSFDVEDIQRAVQYVVPDADLSAVDYVMFVETLISMYHDMSAVR